MIIMKRKIHNYSIILLLGVMLSQLIACKDWTETEALEIANPSVEQQNPALYAAYLEDLRAYKKHPHKINMGWFNNAKKDPSSQGDHIAMVPDSLDYVVLEYPRALVERELTEMKDLLEKKQTKVIFEIDFNSIKTAFLKKEDADLVFDSFVKDSIGNIFSDTDKIPYQGIVIAYQGKELLHLNEQERVQVEAEENLFFSLVKPWLDKNSDKALFYKGNPEFLIQKEILKAVDYIVLPTDNVADAGALNYALRSAMVENVPTDKFIVLASMTSYKPEEAKLGYFVDGSRSALATAQWAASVQNGVQIQGVGYKNLAYDYFNVLKSYQYNREAIQITNPSVKIK